ncbi:MAG: tetratricopeptide repeat protein [Armatimonadota bacterium]
MRRCEDCKIILECDARFCPRCGKSVGATEADEPASARLAVLLTSANLHRLKQEWKEAISDAVAALEIDPSNAEVAALLASIYEQQGNAEEAAVWYRIALELDPQDTASRAGLQRAISNAGTAASGRGKTRRIVAAAAAAVALVVVTSLLTLAFSRPHRGPAPRRATRSAGAKVQMKTPATPSSGVFGPAASGTNLTLASPAAARTPGESALKAALAASETVRAYGAGIDDVIADPRQGLVVATFWLPATTPVTRARVLSAAAAVARSVFNANAEVRSVTARCIITPGGPSTTQIAFVGEVMRSTMEGLGDNPTDQQLESAFTGAWWNPQVR